MYTNQTAEELELERCTSDGIFLAMTSSIMKVNIVFSIVIIFLTFWYSYNAIMLLVHRNIYSNCSRILLIFNLIDSNIWQTNYLITRIRDSYHILVFSNDPCQIEFHYPECVIQHPINHYTTIFSVFCIFSLTCDRFLSFFLNNFYSRHQKAIPTIMISIFILLSLLAYLYFFYGIVLAGYVPSCYYPPQLSLSNFDKMNNLIFYFMIFNFLLSFVILLLNVRKDRRICHYNFDTSTRYISFENLETTKAIFSISTTQLFFLSITSLATLVIRSFEAEMNEKTLHQMVPFVASILYGNLSIPVLICYQTRKCIARRKKQIGSMTSTSEDIHTHISSLKKMWS